MAKYLLIESRDPFENNVVARQYDLAVNLMKEGNDVTLFLVQNGVLPARSGERSALLTSVAKGASKCWRTNFRCASAASRSASLPRACGPRL